MPAFPRRTLLTAALAATCLLIAAACPPSSAQEAKTPPQAEKRITPAEAKKLFALVDELMQFASDESGLPIKAPVKRQLTSREAVEKYMKAKMEEDKSAQRLQRDEILLKKFGLLDRDFHLGPFLLSLLKEQIAGYYDEKTKTVNLLDWLDAELQKPVMAHELTHALQDQAIGLEQWGQQTPSDISLNSSTDSLHLTRDEWDTAREAVAEGQATAVMTDYILKPMGKSVISTPEVVEMMRTQMSANGDDSPIMARAPLLLTESMLFSYREGLSFEQDIWMDKGQKAAFAGALAQPPTSSWEILNPREYELRHMPPVPLLPNIHALVDPLYKPYDIGQIGQLDLHILTQLLGGEPAAKRLTPAWNGGIYWAGQLKSAKTPAEQASTASLGIFYLSVWSNAASAADFAMLYGQNLDRKYSHVEMEKAAGNGREERQIYSTSEGPVVITRRGTMVFVAESFPRTLALQLTDLVLDAQGTGATQFAQAAPSAFHMVPSRTPSAELAHLFMSSGVLKCVLKAHLALK